MMTDEAFNLIWEEIVEYNHFLGAFFSRSDLPPINGFNHVMIDSSSALNRLVPWINNPKNGTVRSAKSIL